MASKRNLIFRAFTWAVVYTTLFVLVISAVLIALVVGDWIILRTGNSGLAWAVGVVILTGFLASLGAAIGVWIWLRYPASPMEVEQRHHAIDKILADMSVIERD